MTPPCRPMRTIAALAAALLGAGCQSYERRPLDADAAREAWLARSPGDEAVRAFAARLARWPSDAPAEFDPGDGLSLDEAHAVALLLNRELRLARLEAGVAAADARYAGLLDDPSLAVDLERILTGIPSPWVISGTLGMTLPVSGRLAAEVARAGAQKRAELQRVAAAEWALGAGLSELWIQWSAQDTRAGLEAELADHLRGIVELARMQERAGSLSRIEARHFQVQLAIQEVRAAAALAEARELRLRLLDVLGLAPSAEAMLVPTLSIEPPRMDADPLAETASRHPALAALAAEYEVAEQSLRLEIRRQYPDLMIGPGVGEDEGDGRLLLGLGVTLPIWNRNQQAIARASAAREAARARYESAFEQLASHLAIAEARLAAATARRETVESAIVPLADEQESEVRGAARLGRVEPLLLGESLQNQHNAKLSLLEAREAEALAALGLRRIVGPPIPWPAAAPRSPVPPNQGDLP